MLRPVRVCLALAFLLPAMTACKEEDAGAIQVDEISLEGVKSVSARQLKSVLATTESAALPWGEKRYFRRDQFEVGRATSDDVLDAESLLARERASAANALYQAHARRAELQQLVGRGVDALYAEAR